MTQSKVQTSQEKIEPVMTTYPLGESPNTPKQGSTTIIPTPQPSKRDWERVAEAIYEATRVEAEWSERSIVPEKWDDRDEKFRNNMVDIVGKYLAMDELPTPEEAHDSWTEAYLKMGWKYGKVRDAVKKTHPDMVPFNELPKDERDKDAIFLAFVWLVKSLLSTLTPKEQK